MKKFLLGLFILFDLTLIGGTAFFLYTYVTHQQKLFPKPLSGFSMTKPMAGAVAASHTLLASSSTTVASVAQPSTAAVTAGESSTRKILFTYRSSHAKQVSIRADFTGWKAEPMVKGANNAWTYQAQLTPGEYAYCYTVDDKTFKDPANKRTKPIGRTLVSAIVVEPLPAKALK